MYFSIGFFLWVLSFALVLLWSGIAPTDRLTWWLEVAPALLALPALALTRKRFPLTTLAYVLVLVHCVILMVGGHYTYALVPLFEWLREPMGWTRNNYDKLGHLAQGFVPALLAREVFLRLQVVKRGPWLAFMVVCFALALSAAYELVEWLVSECTGEGGDAFLGTQGYVWDTQSDMLMALIGASLSVLILSRVHDRILCRHGWLKDTPSFRS